MGRSPPKVGKGGGGRISCPTLSITHSNLKFDLTIIPLSIAQRFVPSDIIYGKHCIFTVLSVKISHSHDFTSYAALGHSEVEFQCGTHRYDT